MPAFIKTLALLLTVLLLNAPLPAQTTRPANPDEPDEPASRLGPLFSSRAGAIAFQPPAGGTMTRRLGVDTEIVQFTNPEQQWSLKVSRLVFDTPQRLLVRDNPDTPNVNEALFGDGLVNQTVRQLRLQNAATEILRQDLINVGAYDTGVIISRFLQANRTWLRQHAILEANDQVFYVFDLTTPSGRTPQDKPDTEDPSEQVAVEIFNSMLDTVRLLDWRGILEENRDRLFRTRTLFLNLPNRIENAIRPHQHFRILHDGQDVGWCYVTEELGNFRGKSGVFTTILLQHAANPQLRFDSASEMFSRIDRKNPYEAWVTISVADAGGQKNHVTEIGRSELRWKLQRLGEGPVAPREQEKTIQRVESYELRVNHIAPAKNQAFAKPLPEFYLPQALATMLPRLLPLNQPQGYLFVSWVGAEREVIFRYVDVEPKRQVTFNSRQVEAVIVRDRIGLDGEPTLHYFAPGGEYLGNVNTAAGLMMVATDAETLKKRWPNATLLRPHLLEQIQEEPPPADDDQLDPKPDPAVRPLTRPTNRP